MAVTQHRLALAGVRTPVLDTGGSSNEAVLFMHGNPGCGRDWVPLMEQVQSFSRAIAPDMPGFGQAEKPHDLDYTVAGYATHIGALVDSLDLHKVHLVLHDFGGPWGLAWAAANPSKVASLTLFNIGVLKGYRWHYLARIWRTPILGEIFQATTSRFGFRMILKHGNPRGLPREFIESMYDNYDRQTRRAVLKLYRATSDLGAVAEEISTALRPLDLDTLVIWGKADPYLPYRFAEAQRDVFPRAEVAYLDDSGHWPYIDNPEAVNALVIPFLRKCMAVDEP
jgi:pimeloyl-ACP methyl ester carboxylesterase